MLQQARRATDERVIDELRLRCTDVNPTERRDCKFTHPDAVLERNEILAEGVLVRWRKPHLGHGLCREHPVRRHDMGHVWRVERAPQNRDLSRATRGLFDFVVGCWFLGGVGGVGAGLRRTACSVIVAISDVHGASMNLLHPG
jgi:hypothetical protein